LIGGDHDALDLGFVVQRLERDDELRRRAIGIGDDSFDTAPPADIRQISTPEKS
jgi:hypothetical protein